MKYSLGALKDKEDKRDYKVSDYLVKAVTQLPAIIDYTNKMQAVRDQGNKGACVGFAFSAIKEYQEKIDVESNLIMSPDWIYLQRPEDISGMEPRDALKILIDSGDCLEDSLPYDQTKDWGIAEDIKAELKEEAYNFRALAYTRIWSLIELKQYLYEKGPCYISVPVYDSFFDTGKNGIVPDPDISKEFLNGYHALCVVGYDDSANKIKFKNSWTEDWGNGGYGYLSYDFINNLVVNQLDMWGIIDTESKKINWFQKIWRNIRNWFKDKNHVIFFIWACIIIFFMILAVLKGNKII